MNKIYLKTIMYILIAILAVVVFFRILPYLVVAGLVAYVVLKIVRYFKDKPDRARFQNNSGGIFNGNKVNIEDDIDPKQAIDVDYKDV
ncbi:hypothetical protein NNC19_10805 [Clostridium sp. SHJSY1]|uniref:hypothetical protein n=1 Tax=Clostridium sp. SHJSY1 TaxID=2942483 RepID=UPI0028749528|nr:hypothetical protein [Clostridium sp. SHJSY1]MDS0526171.1 hypothetical protein [Clostridium sp. SHJSY1]